jgi:tetratricopeptide (TPR) repeat protein
VLCAALPLLGACQKDAPKPEPASAPHWRAASTALSSAPDQALALMQIAQLFDLSPDHAVDVMRARAAVAARGALPERRVDRDALQLELELLLERPALPPEERADLLTAKAHLALSAGDRAGARRLLDAARQAAPVHAASAKVLGKLSLDEGRDADALSLLEPLVLGGELAADTSTAYATALMRTAQLERAVTFLAGASTLHADPTVLELFAEAAARLGQLHLALPQLEQRVTQAPTASLERRLGEAYLAMGRLDEAEALLRRALAPGPDVEASLSLARLELERGHPQRARASVERLAAQLPARPHALFTAAWVLARTGEEAAARSLAAQFGQLALKDGSLSRQATQLAALFKP